MKKLWNWIKKNYIKIAWIGYHILRKKYKFDPDLIKKVPLGAIISVFGNNKLTKLWQYITTGVKDTPTHTAIYLGNGKHEIAEADVFFTKNNLERYAKSKIVIHYFKDLTQAQVEEIKRRIYFLISQKLRYDITGYTGHIVRYIPKLKDVKWLKASDKYPFCNDAIVTIYQGHKRHAIKQVKKWSLIKWITEPLTGADPNLTTPADVYLFLDKLREVEKIILLPKENK